MSLVRFWADLPFEPDPFQLQAAEAVEAGRTVVVTAPTGSGKTLVAEAAVFLALGRGRRAFYTTPLKALSNQKFVDFVGIYGRETVGLLTGDNVIRGDAPLVVMTTEVLRNMIYADSKTLDLLDVVVLDEVHYLQDPFRGAVWEEIIIHTPRSVQLVSLSATVSNPGAFADWVEARRGPTALVVEENRPVPLESLFLVKDRAASERPMMYPMFAGDDQRPNPDITRLLARRRGRRRRFATPRRTETCLLLAEEGMTPAIYFIFSRAGCEAAAGQVVDDGLSLTTPDEQTLIRRLADERTEQLTDAELKVLSYGRWVHNLMAGVAPHHAGMVPAFKETVEELFGEGLVKLVFATETLSLGINMPAKTVVLETMTKFTGEGHEPLQPGDYTQLTGRAGRRGIDTEGFGVTLYSPYMNFDRMAGIASAGSHPIRSSFRPTYNMAVNLIAKYPEEEAKRLLAASLAQFQRERGVARLRRSIARNERRLEEAAQAATCDRGDVLEYLEASRANPGRPGHLQAFSQKLRRGSVVSIPSGRREGRNVILQRWGAGGTRLLVVGDTGELSRIRLRDLPAGTAYLGRMQLPTPYRPKSTGYRSRVARLLADFLPSDEAELPESEELRRHPVHGCPDRDLHLQAARRMEVLERDMKRQRRRLRSDREGLVGEFDRVTRLLSDWGYVNGWTLTSGGETLRFLYNELDLLLAEALRRGFAADMEPAELAAFASAFVYQPRQAVEGAPWPTATLAAVGDDLSALAKELNRAERERGLPVTRPPEPGMSGMTHMWATGGTLEAVLGGSELAAGDFVRTSRQLIDLLRQVRDAAPDARDIARAAIQSIDRSVVSASGVL